MAVTGSEGFVQGASFASMLKVHNSIDGNILSYFNAVIGKVPGPMGATCMLVMFGTAIAFFYFPFFPLAQFRGLCSGVLRMFCSLPADFDGAQAVPNDGDFSGHAGVYRAVSFARIPPRFPKPIYSGCFTAWRRVGFVCCCGISALMKKAHALRCC